MLSPVLLDELRAHWRRLRKKSGTWLFPGNRWHSSDQPIDTKTRATPVSTLRVARVLRRRFIPTCIAFATRVEVGADLQTIQILLGHHDLKETAIYLHLSQRHLHVTASHLDSLSLKERSSQEE